MSAANPHQLLVNMVVFATLMTMIAYVYLRNQLRPITRLARAAEAFGKGRRVDYRPAGAVEVKAAGQAFVEMRDRIARQIEQRTLLLSGVSHDLRTPLTRMRLCLSMLEPGEDVDALLSDVEDMERMIDAFLDFARGQSSEEPVVIDLKDMLEGCLDDERRAGHAVELAAPLPEVSLSLRPVAVQRAIAYLLSTAARYGRRVRLSCEAMERAVRIRVEDDGPGIRPEDRAAAMRPFMRLDAARNQNKGGSVGLGLAIAADTARRHGGTLRLGESPDLGGLSADLVLSR